MMLIFSCDYRIAFIDMKSVMLRGCLVLGGYEETCPPWPVSKCHTNHAVHTHHDRKSDF